MCECVWGGGRCVRAYVQMHVCLGANVFVCVRACVRACVCAGTCMRYASIRPIQHGMIIVSMALCYTDRRAL